MRGKAKEEPYRPCHPGITPAYAGKSRTPQGLRPRSGDYPRVCGEKAYSKEMAGSEWGSPPRMRGKVLWAKLYWSMIGITPAYAGKSFKVKEFACKDGDHPRVCGEKLPPHCCFCPAPGSPPRMRGKEVLSHRSELCFGITPAYAGKSFPFFGFIRLHWDHPRVCGEKTKKIP